MVFTIVTIVFLPLTAIASIYSMNAKDFGQGDIPLQKIFKIMFPVSAGIAIAILLLAFAVGFRKIFMLMINIAWAWCTQKMDAGWVEDKLQATLRGYRKEKEKSRSSRQPKTPAPIAQKAQLSLQGNTRKQTQHNALQPKPSSSSPSSRTTHRRNPQPSARASSSAERPLSARVRNSDTAPSASLAQASSLEYHEWLAGRRKAPSKPIDGPVLLNSAASAGPSRSPQPIAQKPEDVDLEAGKGKGYELSGVGSVTSACVLSKHSDGRRSSISLDLHLVYDQLEP